MSKLRITWLFVMVFTVGILGAIFFFVGWFANIDDVFIRNGNIVSVCQMAFVVGFFVFGFIGVLGIFIAAVIGIVVWIGVLLNIVGFERKRWFVAIAFFGFINCGLLGVLAYLVAGLIVVCCIGFVLAVIVVSVA